MHPLKKRWLIKLLICLPNETREKKIGIHNFNKWTMICTQFEWIECVKWTARKKCCRKYCDHANRLLPSALNICKLWFEWNPILTCVRCGMLCGVEYYVWIFVHSNMWNSNDAMDFPGNIYYFRSLAMHTTMCTNRMAHSSIYQKITLHIHTIQRYVSVSGTWTKNSKNFCEKNDKKSFRAEYISFVLVFSFAVTFVWAISRYNYPILFMWVVFVLNYGSLELYS